MNLIFLGTGEAFSEKANTSILVDGIILLECGLTTVQQLFKAGVGFDRIKLIYISHLHADHSFGLPSFLVTCKEELRQDKIVLIGPPGLDEHIKNLLDLAYKKRLGELGFIVEIREAEGGIQFEGYRFSFAEMEHPVPCSAVSVEKDGRKLTYTGDGSPTSGVEEIAEDADLLIAEGYMEGIMGHSSITRAAEFARECGARRLAVVHVSRRENLREKLRAAEKIFSPILIPEDLGMVGI